MKPPQLLRFAQMDYRRLEDLLTSSAELRVALGLESVPDHSTFQVPDHSTFHWFMATTLRLFRRRSQRGETVAVDATGFSRCPASHYYMRRPARRFLMLSMVVWVRPQVICAPGVWVGPGSPSRLLPPWVQETVRHGAVRRLLPSADSDSEPTHRWLQEEQGIESIIPATGCCPGRDWTLYRRRTQRYFPRRKYGQRWTAETVASVLERRFGDALTTRRWWQQVKQALLRGLV
jgi:hypothetical protein